MISRFGQFLRDNRFAVVLWLGIVILLSSAYRKGFGQQAEGTSGGGQGGQGGKTECNFYTGLALVIYSADTEFSQCASTGVNLPSAPAASAVRFELNVGQADASYSFVAHGRQQAILLSSSEAVFQWKGSKKTSARAIHASLAGARSGVELRGDQPLSGHVNYLIGKDPKNWHTDIPTFGAVRSAGVYPSIDVVYHGNGGDVETDFVVQPGGDPEAIGIRFSGADDVRLESDGSLSARADRRTLYWKKPVLYQTDKYGQTQRVEGRFRFAPDGTLGFEVGVYDVTRPLVIDPVLTYATYFGGAYGDGAARVATDASGNAYMVGSTDAPTFPVTSGTFFSQVDAVQGNVLVAKLSPDGKSMVYETHIGGSNGDLGLAIALDASGNLYLTGLTDSSDYPLLPSGNNQTTKLATDPANCFLTKLSPAGNALVYSTVFGGSSGDACSGVGVDSTGNAYVVGVTASNDLPLKNAIQTTFPAGLFGATTSSAFAAKFSPDGTQLLYSTFFGGTGGNNAATALAVDSAGNAYFTGFTTSTLFPVSANAMQPTYGGSGGQPISAFSTGDAFVVKLSPTGQKVYATYLGGSKDDIGIGIAVDSKGDAYVGGATLSTTFPTVNAFQSTNHGAGGDQFTLAGDGFITELDPTGSTVLFSSFIGGSKDDRVLGVALDSSGNIYLSGQTLSTDFPTAGTQAQSGNAGDTSGTVRLGDAFVTEINASHVIVFSTFLGGTSSEYASGIAVDGTGGIIIAGGTTSTDFPATGSAYQKSFGGTDPFWVGYPVGDAFIARFGGTISSVNITGVSNAASYVSGGIAPGEAILISGANIGPASLAGAALTASGSLATTIASTQFLFNGVAAPIVYVSSQYSSVIVPYEVSTSSSAQIVAVYNGAQSPPFTVPVVAALPGVFSANSSGSGQGAILNQNLTSNSAQNPAPRGSFVVVYVTGEGQTVPPGIDGAITESVINPVLPVSVSFGGVPATSIEFAGETPGVVAGVMQINVYVPQLAPSGVVPLTVTIGSVTTQSGLTVAIQ
jgi:uncharacterized protein (TIGR03437 family)